MNADQIRELRERIAKFRRVDKLIEERPGEDLQITTAKRDHLQRRLSYDLLDHGDALLDSAERLAALEEQVKRFLDRFDMSIEWQRMYPSTVTEDSNANI